jgi:hypothetical protein
MISSLLVIASGRPRTHIDGGRVEIRCGRRTVRHPHVEPQREHQVHFSGLIRVLTPIDDNLTFVHLDPCIDLYSRQVDAAAPVTAARLVSLRRDRRNVCCHAVTADIS